MQPSRSQMRVLWRIHKWIWRLSGGRLGARIVGMPVLELITTGRTSGEPRSVLLTFLEHGDAYVVIASNAGLDTDPMWWRNLQATPRATVRRRGQEREVVARIATDVERDALWARAVEVNNDYAAYAEQAGRPIPVVVLDPA